MKYPSWPMLTCSMCSRAYTAHAPHGTMPFRIRRQGRVPLMWPETRSGQSCVILQETVKWNAQVQFNNVSQPVELPRMMLGDTWLGQNARAGVKSPVVDDVKDIVGAVCSRFFSG